MTCPRIGALAILLALSCSALAQATLTNAGHASEGATLRVGPPTISFDIVSSDLPKPGHVTYISPSGGDATELDFGIALPGVWLLEVGVSTPLLSQNSLNVIPASDVQVAGEPTSDSAASDCPPIPWTSLGPGTRLAALSGPLVCRYHVRFRLTYSGDYAPGKFTGMIEWSLSQTDQ